MRIAFSHNLRLTDSEEEAEFDSAETVQAIADGLRAGGHEVETIEVTGPASHLAARLESFGPDLIFNNAEGRRGRTREAFYPALFEELGFPYTGSDAYVLTVTLDKWLTKLVLSQRGIDTPRGRLVTPDEYKRLSKDPGTLGLALPVIVKPNYEGSSKGIGDDVVVRDPKTLSELLPKALRAYPNGVLVEEFIPGTDVTVPFLEGRGDEGVLLPVDYVVDPSAKSRFNLYDYRLKSAEANKVQVRCPPDLPRDVTSRLQALAKMATRTLGIRDVGRVDFRLGEDGRIYLLEVNALPSLEHGASLFAASGREALTYDETLQSIVESAARRQGLVVKPGARRRRPAEPLRIGFTFNVKRVDTKGGNDSEAEYDAPETIDSIREALESYGHQVIPFEATAELPRQLMQTPVDLVFNIAEGVAGRNREAAVPALCELMGIPYTGSDAATLSIALDKALSKRVLMQHEILTAEFQVMETGRERLSPKLKFPLIVKPNQEGSSKGVSASASVVDDEEGLRAIVKELIDRYRQPALIEAYIPGREFTVGLLGDRRPRVLPPMEILFKDKTNERPVYDFQIKQEWEKHVSYECPAKLTPLELKAIERVCRETFAALDCRDVARVDLRLTPKGEFYVIEVNPLPGLTPGYSDLCLIAKAAGIEYRTLIGDILEGGLKRLREKRREAREAAEARAEGRNGERPAVDPRQTELPRIGPQQAAPGEGGMKPQQQPRARLRDLGFSIGRFPVGRWNAITDVAGVRVGHTTLVEGDGPLEVGKGPVRTGVTAVIPNADIFGQRAVAGGFVLNGAGEVSGLTQVQEWGLLETPILLTNTMAVGKVSDAVVKWMTRKWPKIGGEEDVVIPLVGECDDSWLNDAVGRHVRSEHVYRAIEQASSGPVPEGAVGAGTGLITCDFKAGIGTSSRRVAIGEGAGLDDHSYTVGVLVQSNFGVMRSLRIDGAPVGEVLEPLFSPSATPRRERNAGSIITVIATDAPLLSPQLVRVCKRAALGIGRSGSFAAHGSGEIIVAFSTANIVPREASRMTATLDVLLDEACDPLYEATVECTEEAIANALCMADEMRGPTGHTAPGLPLDRLTEILTRYKAAFTAPEA